MRRGTSLGFAAMLVVLRAAAAVAQSATTYEACYVPSVGARSLINRIGLPTACLASGTASTAVGIGTIAQAYASGAIGRNNAAAGTATSWTGTDPLLIAGNGSSSSAGSNALTLHQDGNLTIAGTLTQSSDIRLKQDIEPLDGALDGVLRLTPIAYRFRTGTGHPTTREIGLSAQEVRAVFPELVSEEVRGYLSVAYPNLTAMLVKAVQEQQVQNATLRGRIEQLEAALAARQ